MTWFEELTGVRELDAEHVRSQLYVSDGKLHSRANQKVWEVGSFSTPKLSELRQALNERLPRGESKIQVRELVGNSYDLIGDRSNADSVFQVASQFNCLEMASPDLTPENGVGIYENDFTQGPACSIAAGAGTIYRNYFAKVGSEIGQSRLRQVDCLADVGRRFATDDAPLWRMQNGYCFPSKEGLAKIESDLQNCDEASLDSIRAELRVGIQKGTEVTIAESPHLVTQVFCSALPIAYSDLPACDWNLFPRMVLDATYEATFWAALENWSNTGNSRVFLTLVGGGVFGNRMEWILPAIKRALRLFRSAPLEVEIVSFRRSNLYVDQFVSNWNSQP